MGEKRGCLLALMLSTSFISWIVMAFVDIRTWLMSLISIVVMAIFDYGCHKECNRVFFGPNYVIGVIVSLMVGSSMGIPTAQLIVGTILLPMLYTVVIEFYVTKDHYKDEYDDA